MPWKSACLIPHVLFFQICHHGIFEIIIHILIEHENTSSKHTIQLTNDYFISYGEEKNCRNPPAALGVNISLPLRFWKKVIKPCCSGVTWERQILLGIPSSVDVFKEYLLFVVKTWTCKTLPPSLIPLPTSDAPPPLTQSLEVEGSELESDSEAPASENLQELNKKTTRNSIVLNSLWGIR